MRSTTLFLLFAAIVSYSVHGQDALPSASVKDMDGVDIDLSQYVQKNQKPKIISLWATWCGPCRMELNALKQVYPKWKQLYNVEIIAVTVDYPSMLKRAKKMFVDNNWDFTFFHDVNQDLMGKLGIQGIPFSMLLDSKGKVQSVQMGYFPGYEKDLEKKIKALKI